LIAIELLVTTGFASSMITNKPCDFLLHVAGWSDEELGAVTKL
jgi:hypothetical protein